MCFVNTCEDVVGEYSNLRFSQVYSFFFFFVPLTVVNKVDY